VVLLVVVGFALGLVAGAAFEEPSLVADHLAGRTTEVPLADEPAAREAEGRAVEAPDASPVAAVPEPAEAPRRPLGAPRDASPPPAEAAPRPRPEAAPPPAVAAAPPRTAPAAADGFAIQVGAFAERGAAQALADRLQGLEHPAYVVAEEQGRARFKVRVGPFSGRSEAERLAARLKREQRLPTWILSTEAR
jgi:DedD protein